MTGHGVDFGSDNCLNQEALWQETRNLVQRETGVLVLDGATLDKPHAARWNW